MEYSKLTAEQKKERAKYNLKYANKYRSKNFSSFSVSIHKDGSDGFTIEQLKHSAEVTGRSVNKLVIDAILKEI